jgi:hypothetical protein
MPVTVSRSPRPASEVIAELMAAATVALNAHGARVESAAKARWVGWKNPTGTSRDAWRTGTVERTSNGLRITIGNAAENKQGTPYAEYVHRSGVSTPEVQLLERDEFPPLTDVLRTELSATGSPLI